jgi:hypothetical protein
LPRALDEPADANPQQHQRCGLLAPCEPLRIKPLQDAERGSEQPETHREDAQPKGEPRRRGNDGRKEGRAGRRFAEELLADVV